MMERRETARWHSTKPLQVTLLLPDTTYAGILYDVSTTGLSILLGRMPPPVFGGSAGRVLIETNDVLHVSARLARLSETTAGVRFAKALSDAQFASIVEKCNAYSIQYRDQIVHFAGDMGNQTATEHLLRCVRQGGTVDLSRARGGAEAGMTLKLMKDKGAMFRRCSEALDTAFVAIDSVVCKGCSCSQGERELKQRRFRLLPAFARILADGDLRLRRHAADIPTE